EVEESEDAKTLNLQAALSNRKDSVRALALSNAAQADRPVKNYKSKFMNVLKKAVAERFSAVLVDTADASAVFDKLDKCLKDLAIIQRFLEPCFPQRYHIMDFFIVEYHRNVYDTIRSRCLVK